MQLNLHCGFAHTPGDGCMSTALTRTHTQTHTHTHACMHRHTQVQLYIHTWSWYTHAYTQHTHIHPVHVCMHACMNTHTHLHINVYTGTQGLRFLRMWECINPTNWTLFPNENCHMLKEFCCNILMVLMSVINDK